MAKRKPRDYEKTCTCKAYPFPHRFLGGRCKGAAVVAASFGSEDCENCILNDCGQCQVLNGQEAEKTAPCLHEYIRFENVRPPQSWKRGGLKLHRLC